MDEFEIAKSIAYRFLSYRPRSKKEIESKLREKKISDKTIKNTIVFLEENNYINDENFALNWIKYRLENRPRGRKFLDYELREKGIPSDLIKESLDKVYANEFNEYEVAAKLLEKKIASLKNKKMEYHVFKGKLYNYLQRKGFSYDLIEKVISNIADK